MYLFMIFVLMHQTILILSIQMGLGCCIPWQANGNHTSYYWLHVWVVLILLLLIAGCNVQITYKHVHMTNTCCASSATYMYKWWTSSVINTYKCSTCSITGLADETLSDQGQQISCQYLTRHPAHHPQQVALKSNWPESFLCHLKYLDVKLLLDCSRAVPTNQKKVRVRRAMLRTGWRPDFVRWVLLPVIENQFALLN